MSIIDDEFEVYFELLLSVVLAKRGMYMVPVRVSLPVPIPGDAKKSKKNARNPEGSIIHPDDQGHWSDQPPGAILSCAALMASRAAYPPSHVKNIFEFQYLRLESGS
jgi:hypothetical protein